MHTEKPSYPIRLLLADDHHIVLDGLRLLMGAQPDLEIAATASSRREVLEKIESAQPHIVLLDITLGDDDGIALCKELKQLYPHVSIIALTMYDSGSYLQGMIANGATGYILKDANVNELIEAIHTVHNGGTYFSKKATDKMMGEMVKQGVESRRSTIRIKISQREKEILRLIVKEYTTSEIAEKLFVSINTVETHRANLLLKLDCKNVAGLVRVAIENQLLE